MEQKIALPNMDLRAEFRLLNLLMANDSHINDVADHENLVTPLMMILLNKNLMRNTHIEDQVTTAIEGLIAAGAIFEATEQQKDQIKKFFQGRPSHRPLYQTLLASITESHGEATVGHETIASKRNQKIIIEGEEKEKTGYNCFFCK